MSDVFLELVSTLRGTNCAGPTASKWNLPTTKGDQRKDVEPSRASRGANIRRSPAIEVAAQALTTPKFGLFDSRKSRGQRGREPCADRPMMPPTKLHADENTSMDDPEKPHFP